MPKLKPKDRRSASVFVRLRPEEARRLREVSRERRRRGLPVWTKSSILREGFLEGRAWAEGRGHG